MPGQGIFRFCAGLAFLLAGPVAAPGGTPGGPEILGYRLAAGETLRYRLEEEVEAEIVFASGALPFSVRKTALVTCLVREILPCGSAVIRAETTRFEAGVAAGEGGSPATRAGEPAGESRLLTLTPEGRIYPGRGAGPDRETLADDRLLALIFPPLPGRPVRPGDAWRAEREAAGPFPGEIGESRFLARREEYTVETTGASFIVSVAGAGNEAPATDEFTGRIEFASGRLLEARLSSHFESRAAPGPEGSSGTPGFTLRGEAKSRLWLLDSGGRRGEDG